MASKARNQHVAYGILMAAIVISLLLVGNHYVTRITDDYNARISDLNKELEDTRVTLKGLIDDKQDQIDALTQEFEQTTEQQATQLRDLRDATDEFGTRIGELDQQVSDLAVESETFSIIISEVIDSVVSVLTDTGQGSGAIISPEGYVVTNFHVIDGARMASVMTYDGKTYAVSLVGFDRTNDLAVLDIVSEGQFDHFDFGNSDKVKAGQKVVALGNPAGLSFTATEGIVSSASRTANDGLEYIQTDVTLNPGNSGGPLINSQGDIIGIADFKVSGYEGLGFAIPSNRAEDVIGNIIASAGS